MDKLGMTSRLVAAARERESQRADRLFDDPFAGALAGDDGRALMEVLESVPRQGGPSGPRENPYLSIRTRFLDDIIRDAWASGFLQFVILAAGMDSRAFRLDWPEGTTVFEVERPEVLEYKESILTGLGARPVASRRIVAIDLREDFCTALRIAGFKEHRATVFLMEGLLPYLPDEATVRDLLSKITSIAAPGSILAFDTIGQSFLNSPWTQQFLKLMATEGAPWQFGTDDPEGLLQQVGFKDVRVVQPGEYLPARWPFPSMPRFVSGVPRSYLVTARR